MSRSPLPTSASSGFSGAVLIPVKAFSLAKERLSGALQSTQRASLAEQMATHVVTAQHGVQVGVCCDDNGVAQWAESVGAHPIWCPGTDLNGAVQHGVTQVRAAGYSSVAIAHGDLPLAVSLHSLLGWSGVTLVPDRHRTGSNVISFATSIDFQFSYGTGSFHRHLTEAVRHRRGLRIVHNPQLGWDIDHPADLELPDAPEFAAFLQEST